MKTVKEEEKQEEKVEKHKTFVEKYAKEIKHFGMIFFSFDFELLSY